MKQSAAVFCLIVTASLLAQVSGISADGRVVLNIRAVNPSDQPKTVEIKSNLPPDLKTNDIVSLDGMELDYDAKSGLYFVHAGQELGPRQIISFSVVIKDIWLIPRETIAQLVRQVTTISRKLADMDKSGKGTRLAAEINDALREIARHQSENETPKVSTEQHIDAYARDIERLKAVKEKIVQLGNLAVVAGQDQGFLAGAAGDAVGSSRVKDGSGNGRAIVKVVVMNLSSGKAQKIDVRHELPDGISNNDVIDADGLLVRTDPVRGTCYVYGDAVEVKPNETVEFKVVIRDKWNIHGNRIAELERRAVNVLAGLPAGDRFNPARAAMKEAIGMLNLMAKEQGPKNVTGEYIAFYRAQAGTVERVEQLVERVESMIREAVDPSRMENVWPALYAILVFLAIIVAAAYIRTSTTRK